MAIDLKALSKRLTPVTDREAAKIMKARTAANAHRYVRASRTKTIRETSADPMEDEANPDGRNDAPPSCSSKSIAIPRTIDREATLPLADDRF